ncbi:MAG: hypothetical protein IIV90_03395, partial [Oscillospiraceae bacterium]|nr:hypothetical protein [Oscillospiraceae bacterium]
NRDMTFPPGCGTIKPKQLPFEMNGGAECSIYYNMYKYIQEKPAPPGRKGNNDVHPTGTETAGP